MPKIFFNKKFEKKSTSKVELGRRTGTVTQIVGLGDQPAYKVGDPPCPSVGVVVQLSDGQVAKRMRICDSPYSAIFSFLNAALPNPDDSFEDPLPLTLGCPVSLEIVANGNFQNVESFHRPMEFELSDAPKVDPDSLLFLEKAEDLVGEEGKQQFHKLHPEIRGWLSKRVRG